MVKKVCQRLVVVYYESIRHEVKIRPIYECRCDERLQTKAEESTRLAYTGLLGELAVFIIMCVVIMTVGHENG
jgi:hypothetical protein